MKRKLRAVVCILQHKAHNKVLPLSIARFHQHDFPHFLVLKLEFLFSSLELALGLEGLVSVLSVLLEALVQVELREGLLLGRHSRLLLGHARRLGVSAPVHHVVVETCVVGGRKR